MGPKTVDYLSILSGGGERAAIDVHVRSFLHSAGVLTGTYDEDHALIEAVAEHRGWTPGALDAVIWAHQSRK